MEENEGNGSSFKSRVDTNPDACSQLSSKSITNSTLTATGSSEAPSCSMALPLGEKVLEGDGSLEKELAIDNTVGEKMDTLASISSSLWDFNDKEDMPMEFSKSSDINEEAEL